MSPTKRKPGSLNDLLPRPGTTVWKALPPWLQAEVNVIRKGYRPMPPGEMDDLAQLPGRIERLSIEQSVLASTIRDVHKAQSELGGKLLALLAEIQKEQAEHRSQLSDHDRRLDGHDIQLGVHAKKHSETAVEITAVHRRIDGIEQATKRPTRRGKKS